MFVVRAWQLLGDERPGAAMSVFGYSIIYLTLIFVAVGADQLILR